MGLSCVRYTFRTATRQGDAGRACRLGRYAAARWRRDEGASQIIDPTGSLSRLLISAAGEVVAAVWTSPDEGIRHYIIPWLPAWTPLLEWLGQQAIPEFVPTAVRRIHAKTGEDPGLQTTAEASAHAALAELEQEYRVRRDDLMQRLDEAHAAADDLRQDLFAHALPNVTAERSQVRQPPPRLADILPLIRPHEDVPDTVRRLLITLGHAGAEAIRRRRRIRDSSDGTEG
jgi:hypothetical protein